MSSFLKARIRIVLVETSHPGNIGAAARAMKTMSLQRLYLVNPVEYPAAAATSRASGADDVLAAAVVCDSLSAALTGCTLVVGTSARSRRIKWPLLHPKQCAKRIYEDPGTGDVAIVFGRERSGLKNEEMDLCQTMLHIPTSDDYTSLNLAAAVQIIAYELYQQSLNGEAPVSNNNDDVAATHEQLEGYFSHLWEALIKIDFLDPDNPGQLKRRLRRIYSKARPTSNEVNILRGILKSTLELGKERR